MRIRPFKGVRPPQELAAKVSARAYDVMSSMEAREEVAGLPMSLLHITKPEINFPAGTDEHDECVYPEVTRQYQLFRQNGWLVQDEQPMYYVYAQTMGERTQYGIVVTVHVDDYLEGHVKKHELTRKDKEDDRMRHVEMAGANMGPAFFAYPHRDDMDALVAEVVKAEPEYDFIAREDGFRHTMWPVTDPAIVAEMTRIFAEIPTMYIADGHHRSAAAARVGEERRKANPNHTGEEEYNYFLTVCFPDNQLCILDYNRVVRDLNGLSEEEFLAVLQENFEVEKMGGEIYRPACLHEFSMYLAGQWYRLTAKVGTYDDNDPIGVLDVTISSNLILEKILGIKDLRTDKRIDFVGGLRGLGELQRRVDSGEMKMALALYPVTMQQIIDIADSGNIMPPKTTWFEPKLRSGIVVHEL